MRKSIKRILSNVQGVDAAAGFFFAAGDFFALVASAFVALALDVPLVLAIMVL